MRAVVQRPLWVAAIADYSTEGKAKSSIALGTPRELPQDKDSRDQAQGGEQTVAPRKPLGEAKEYNKLESYRYKPSKESGSLELGADLVSKCDHISWFSYTPLFAFFVFR